jgi:hypothetical protein
MEKLDPVEEITKANLEEEDAPLGDAPAALMPMEEALKEVKKEVYTFPAVIERTMKVTIRGPILVAKPVPYEVALDLSPYSPIPPKFGGKWSAKEKEENQKRERARWALGKEGHYKISEDALRLSDDSGHGIPSATIMRAMQEANAIVPGYRLPPKLLNMAVAVLPQARAVHHHQEGQQQD